MTFRRARFVSSWSAILLALMLASACRPAGPTSPRAASAFGEAPAGYPPVVLASTVHGYGQPALFLGPDRTAPAIGYVSPGVRIELAGAPQNERVPVKIGGGLRVRAWLALTRAALRVQRGGRVRGSPIQVAPGNELVVFGPTEGARYRVAAYVQPSASAEPLGPFAGTYPVAGLDIEPPAATPAAPTDLRQLRSDAPIPVYARAAVGDAIATLAPGTYVVGVVSTRAGFTRVRIGLGPYLIGYVNVALEDPSGGITTITGDRPSGEVPDRIAQEPGRLHRVRRGARLKFNGQNIAIASRQGWAREIARYPTGEVDVFLAVDDEVAMRGLVRARDLTEAPPPGVGGAAPPASATPNASPSSTPSPAEATSPAAVPPPLPATLDESD